MLANDIKKGMQLKLKRSGWSAVMMDNKKGNTRLCEVQGIHREFGLVYIWNIDMVLNPATNQWEPVELTTKQLRDAQTIGVYGF